MGVDSLISLDEHVMADKAVRYLALHDKVEEAESVKKNDFEKASHKNDVDSMHMLEEDLTEYYFQNDVDMVYCTNSTSACGLLRKYYKPKFIIQDEAAVTNIPDAATPLSAYHESVELLVQAGDYKQHHPMSTSKGFNEHLPVLLKSLFEMALVNDLYTAAFVMLVNQFRMHSQIADFPNREFYGGKLINGPQVDIESPQWKTMSKFLHTSKVHNGRRRLAVDCSDGHSHLPEGSTSHANEMEADRLIRFIKAACGEVPPPGGVSLTPADFLVLAFYQSQLRLIRNKATLLGVGSAEVRLEMLNTRVVQGGEGRFVMASFAKNIPGKPLSLGFLTESQGLCVTLTRAKEAIILFGNFLGWAQRLVDRAPSLTMQHGNMKTFGNLVGDLKVKGDIMSSGDFSRWSNQELEGKQPRPEFDTLLDYSNVKGKSKRVSRWGNLES